MLRGAYMELKQLKKQYRVWMRLDGKKCCFSVEAQTAKDAKDEAKIKFPGGKISNAILVSK